MELRIDLGRCEGHGLCEEAAPHLLRLNDAGEPEQISPDLETYAAEARSAVRVCPVAALKLS